MCFVPSIFGAWARNTSQIVMFGTILKTFNRAMLYFVGLLAAVRVSSAPSAHLPFERRSQRVVVPL